MAAFIRLTNNRNFHSIAAPKTQCARRGLYFLSKVKHIEKFPRIIIISKCNRFKIAEKLHNCNKIDNNLTGFTIAIFNVTCCYCVGLLCNQVTDLRGFFHHSAIKIRMVWQHFKHIPNSINFICTNQ